MNITSAGEVKCTDGESRDIHKKSKLTSEMGTCFAK